MRCSRLVRLVGAFAIACGALPLEATAQSASPTYVEFRTPDGSRVLLVPTGGTGQNVVHWVTVNPAGPGEDPLGLPGVGFAAARASLWGTPEIGSRNWLEERRALESMVALERAIANREALGETVPADQRAALNAARAAAARLAEPTAWRRALVASPVTDFRLTETDDGTVLELTCTRDSLPRVARLLVERRERAVLRGLQRHLDDVRRDRVSRLDTPLASLRREVESLAFEGVAANPYRLSQQQTCPLDAAREVWSRCQNPFRTLHVLVGDFEVEPIRAVMEGVFYSTALPSSAPRPGRVPRAGGRFRSATLEGDRAAVAAAFRLPPGTPRLEAQVLVEWLVGSPDSLVPHGLRTAKLWGLRARGQAPFPSNTNDGMLLIEVFEPRATEEGKARRDLRPVVMKLLNDARNGPSKPEYARALAAVAKRRTIAFRDSRRLAVRLAISCGLEGASAAEWLDPARAGTTYDRITSIARELFDSATRAVVTMEAPR